MPSFPLSLPLLRQTLILFCLLLPAPALAAVNYYQLPQAKLIKLAEKNDIEAIWQLQRSDYFDGKQKKQVTRSLEERLPWMRKGAELGDYRMQVSLALHLLEPPAGTPPDPAGAEAWLVQAVAGAGQKIGTGFAYQYHKEGQLILERARLLQRLSAAEVGDPDAMFDMARAYAPLKVFVNTELGDTAEYQRWMERAAGKGHPGAALIMAKDSPTQEEKLKWYRVAADGGNVESMVTLANQARSQKNEPEARRWFGRAAEAGDSEASYRMARYHQADKDTASAIDWYRKAAATGHQEAATELARLVDPKLMSLIAAADKGDGEAAYQLGEHYRRQGDKHRASSAYSRASTLGHLDGQYQYALLLRDAAAQHNAMEQASLKGHAGAKAWLAQEARRVVEAARQQQQRAQQAASHAQDAQRRAFVARIDREGTTDKLEVELYCQYGGQRCNVLRGQAHRAEQGRNQQVEAANRQRLQDVYSTDKRTQEQRNQDHRNRSECMRRKTESIERSNTGQQDWRFTGDC